MMRNENLNYEQILEMIENGTIQEIDIEPTDSEGHICDAIYEYQNQKFYVCLSAYLDKSYDEQVAEQIYEKLSQC